MVRIPASWSTNAFITAAGMLSGATAFLGFTDLRFFLTSRTEREREREVGCWGKGGSGVCGGGLKPGKEAV